MPQTGEFDRIISFSFSDIWIFVCSILLTTDAIRFRCFYIIPYTQIFISFLISLYSLNTLFTETNSSWLIYDSIKALENRTYIVFNLSFPSNTILSYFFFFFFIISLYFLISAVIAQILIPNAEYQQEHKLMKQM